MVSLPGSGRVSGPTAPAASRASIRLSPRRPAPRRPKLPHCFGPARSGPRSSGRVRSPRRPSPPRPSPDRSRWLAPRSARPPRLSSRRSPTPRPPRADVPPRSGPPRDPAEPPLPPLVFGPPERAGRSVSSWRRPTPPALRPPCERPPCEREPLPARSSRRPPPPDPERRGGRSADDMAQMLLPARNIDPIVRWSPTPVPHPQTRTPADHQKAPLTAAAPDRARPASPPEKIPWARSSRSTANSLAEAQGALRTTEDPREPHVGPMTWTLDRERIGPNDQKDRHEPEAGAPTSDSRAPKDLAGWSRVSNGPPRRR